MPVVIKQKGTLDCPVIVCASCAKPLAGRGNVVWADEPLQVVEFYHKRADSPSCAEDTDIYEYSMELSDFMGYLVANFIGGEEANHGKES